MKRKRFTFAVALVAAMLLPALSYAQVSNFDHLKCYKIKDSNSPYVAWQFNLTPKQTQFLQETGCILKNRAKMFCINAQKTNVTAVKFMGTEPSPLPVFGQDAQDYLLYALKCPKIAATDGMPLPVIDQFGARTILVGNHQLLLVPAFKRENLCHNQDAQGTPPVCGGDCTDPNQKCVLNSTGTDCKCESPCGLDATGVCGGTCEYDNQICHNVTLVNGTVECRCDPFVDGCSMDAAGICGGSCPNPSDNCLADTTSGKCSCMPQDVGCKRISSDPSVCGGPCPGSNEICAYTGPSQYSSFFCYCAQGRPCVDSFTTSPQCGGDCPNAMSCKLINFGSGPVGCGCFYN